MLGWTQVMTQRDAELQKQLTINADRLRDDENHIFRNDNRIDDILRRLNILEQKR